LNLEQKANDADNRAVLGSGSSDCSVPLPDGDYVCIGRKNFDFVKKVVDKSGVDLKFPVSGSLEIPMAVYQKMQPHWTNEYHLAIVDEATRLGYEGLELIQKICNRLGVDFARSELDVKKMNVFGAALYLHQQGVQI
jgi:hypothetical protein